MMISWIDLIKLIKILIDDDSIVELINWYKFNHMNFWSRIYNDEYFRVNFVIDVIHTLIDYVYLFVNIQNVEVIVKA